MLRALFTITWITMLYMGCTPAWAQHLVWRSYTSDQGLPSNEVHEVMQNSRGYLWFATAHGLCRFSGYECVPPADTSASRGTGAFLPIKDGKGRIWFPRLGGSVWRVEKDTIRAWEFNDAIALYRQQYRLP